MPELTLRLHPLNSIAQAVWLYSKLEEHALTQRMRIGRDKDDTYWILVNTQDPGQLLEFLRSLPEVTEASTEMEQPTGGPVMIKGIEVALSPFSTLGS